MQENRRSAAFGNSRAGQIRRASLSAPRCGAVVTLSCARTCAVLRYGTANRAISSAKMRTFAHLSAEFCTGKHLGLVQRK